MSESYKVRSTSRSSAVVEDRILSQSSSTRKIIRPLIVDNPNDNNACVKITLLHQKATNKNQFEDISEEPLTRLKAKDIVKLSLDSAETKRVYEELNNLYQVYQKDGVPRGEKQLIVAKADEVIVTDKNKAAIIRNLIHQNLSEDLWEQLTEVNPDLATKLSLARLQHTRNESLKIFESLLGQDVSESDWQAFFENNTWIFGYGLNYQFLKTVISQPVYGGQALDGKGANKGDFLESTQGNVKFTVLVEIKKPSTPLLCSGKYRNDTFMPSPDIIGGLSQLRTNARTWVSEGSRFPKNVKTLGSKNINTVQPRKILVAGNTNQLNELEKCEIFELFRQNQKDAEILTFDEVYERAKFIARHDDVPEVDLSKDCPF